jgi:hypothetical protein
MTIFSIAKYQRHLMVFIKMATRISPQDTSKFTTHGLRVNANVPVISKPKFLWQMGGGYIRSLYKDNTDFELAIL